jgi:hypothetical protein
VPETVHRNELRLLKLVHTLLDFSRIEAGRVTATDDVPHVTGIAVVAFDVTELTNARLDAEAANRAKDEFLAMLGHQNIGPGSGRARVTRGASRT